MTAACFSRAAGNREFEQATNLFSANSVAPGERFFSREIRGLYGEYYALSSIMLSAAGQESGFWFQLKNPRLDWGFPQDSVSSVRLLSHAATPIAFSTIPPSPRSSYVEAALPKWLQPDRGQSLSLNKRLSGATVAQLQRKRNHLLWAAEAH